MTHTNGHNRIKEVPLPPPAQIQQSEPPAWFNLALCSVAVFTGPIVLAFVIGLVYLGAVIAGQTYALFRHSAG